MRYWIYDEATKRVRGPHLAHLLPKQPGFGPETKVAPEGSRGAGDWKRVKDVEELKAFLPHPVSPAKDKPKNPKP